MPGVQKPHLRFHQGTVRDEEAQTCDLLRTVKLCHPFLQWMWILGISKTLNGNHVFSNNYDFVTTVPGLT
jgi:hypothetical protein